MNPAAPEELQKFLHYHFKAHPWHGVKPCPRDGVFNVYLELVPTDTVKFEIDKATGLLKVDRPQKYSSLCPTPYGFIPRTYCGDRVGRITREATGRHDIQGDGDPLDICVFTERFISHADILVTAVPIGGFRMIDKNQADDKIIAVLSGDPAYSHWRDLGDVPHSLLERLRHYFLTYKELPDQPQPTVEITDIYGRDEALEVIRCSLEDYRESYGKADEGLMAFLRHIAGSEGLSSAHEASPGA